MHHVAGIFDDDVPTMADCFEALLFVGALRLMALLSFDDEDRAFDAAEKLQSLLGVKGLWGSGAMQGIEFPYPLAVCRLLHAGARQVEREFVVQPGIALLELPCSRFDAGVLTEMFSAAFVQLPDPFFHSRGCVGEIKPGRANPFYQNKFRHSV